MDSWFSKTPHALASYIEQSLHKWFPQRILMRADDYCQAGAVRQLEYLPQQAQLNASVQGSEPDPY